MKALLMAGLVGLTVIASGCGRIATSLFGDMEVSETSTVTSTETHEDNARNDNSTEIAQ
jgi:hypothetical protein